MNEIIELPDGYNGHTALFYTAPLETDGNLLKLRVVGSTYLFRWARKSEVETAKRVLVAGLEPYPPCVLCGGLNDQGEICAKCSETYEPDIDLPPSHSWRTI